MVSSWLTDARRCSPCHVTAGWPGHQYGSPRRPRSCQCPEQATEEGWACADQRACCHSAQARTANADTPKISTTDQYKNPDKNPKQRREPTTVGAALVLRPSCAVHSASAREKDSTMDQGLPDGLRPFSAKGEMSRVRRIRSPRAPLTTP